MEETPSKEKHVCLFEFVLLLTSLCRFFTLHSSVIIDILFDRLTGILNIVNLMLSYISLLLRGIIPSFVVIPH